MKHRLATGLLGVVLCLWSTLAHGAGSDEREKKLPQADRKWLVEEVPYIIAKAERETFLSLESQEERSAFIEAFWRRRDSNPATPENEFREEHYKRLAYVNGFFGRDTSRPGWMTDRGRYYILLGQPTERQDMTSEEKIYPCELWFYNNPGLKDYGLPPFFYLLFFRRHGTGELSLYSPITDGPLALLTGYQFASNDSRQNLEKAYDKLYAISSELAQASLSFRTDEGDVAQFQSPSFGTASLLDDIAGVPFRRVDTAYAENFRREKGHVESDYAFNYVQSYGLLAVLPGPGDAHYLHWVIELDPQNVAVVKDEEKHVYGTQFILTAEVVSRSDPAKKIVDARKESFVTLNEAEAQSGLRLPFSYSGLFPVTPGAYDVRITLRNRACASTEESSCRKSYTFLEGPIEVPAREPSRPRLSDLVLAYGAESRPKPLYRPFSPGALQLLPNTRHVYAASEKVVAMVEPAGAGTGHQVRFRLVNRDALETPLTEKLVAVSEFRLEPVVSELSLFGFKAGYYRLTADLVGPAGEVVESRSADFDVTALTALPRPAVRGSWAEVNPEVPGLLEISLAGEYLALGDQASARKLLEASLVANPKLGPAREMFASLSLQDGDAARAVELLEPVYREVKDRYEVLALLGEAYFQQKNFGPATELLEKAIALRRPEARLLNVLALCHVQQGNPARARELLERSLSLRGDQPEVKALLEKLKLP